MLRNRLFQNNLCINKPIKVFDIKVSYFHLIYLKMYSKEVRTNFLYLFTHYLYSYIQFQCFIFRPISIFSYIFFTENIKKHLDIFYFRNNFTKFFLKVESSAFLINSKNRKKYHLYCLLLSYIICQDIIYIENWICLQEVNFYFWLIL